MPLPDDLTDGHVSDDDLAVLALGDHLDDEGVYDHVTDCGRCTARFREYEHTYQLMSGVGRGPEPGGLLWTTITAELGDELLELDAAASPTEALGDLSTVSLHHLEVPTERQPELHRADGSDVVVPVAPAPTTPLPDPVEPGRVVPLRSTGRRRSMQAVVALVAAAVIAVVVVTAAILTGRGDSPESVAAAAVLRPVPGGGLGTDVGQDFGSAEWLSGAKGPELRVNAADLPSIPGAYEVWLFGPDGRMVSLGVLRDGTGTFTVPQGIDLSQYRVVDISDEPADGVPTHSGKSVVRGDLA